MIIRNNKKGNKWNGQKLRRNRNFIPASVSIYVPIPLKNVHQSQTSLSLSPHLPLPSSLFSFPLLCFFSLLCLPEAQMLKWSHSWHTPHLEDFWSPSPPRQNSTELNTDTHMYRTHPGAEEHTCSAGALVLLHSWDVIFNVKIVKAHWPWTQLTVWDVYGRPKM